jgi:hypothetical protein
MGIRFFCPNGHRLHVKSFLAGKRGVCPDCGQGVDIPLKSDDRALSKKKLNDPANLGAGDEDPEIPLPPAQSPVLPSDLRTTAQMQGTVVAVPSPNLANLNVPTSVVQPAPTQPKLPQPVATPVTAVKPMAAVPAAAPVVKAVVPVAAVPMPSPSVPASAMPVTPVQAVAPAPVAAVSVAPPQPAPPQPAMLNDPIAEAPMAIWYVRPSSGGQFGPARGEVMQKWLIDGRVTNDSLVWREGWPDWRNASQVFPNLQATAIAAPPPSPVVAEASRRLTRPTRKTSSGFGVAVVVILTLVAVALVIALFYLLNK